MRSLRFPTIPLVADEHGWEEFTGHRSEADGHDLPAIGSDPIFGETELLEWERSPGRAAGGQPQRPPGVVPPNLISTVVFFKMGSTELRPADRQAGDSLIHLMSALGKIQAHIARVRRLGRRSHIIVHGFASEEGGRQRNQVLSNQRAARIKQLLEAANLQATITIVGNGAKRRKLFGLI
jgi:outer membrane protein OmpA-like peptidoglycan-associated protein